MAQGGHHRPGWNGWRVKISSQGSPPGSSPGRVSLRLRLEGLAFWAVEYIMSRIWHVGEEIVLEATK